MAPTRLEHMFEDAIEAGSEPAGRHPHGAGPGPRRPPGRAGRRGRAAGGRRGVGRPAPRAPRRASRPGGVRWTCTARAWSRWPGRAPRRSRSSHRSSWPAHLGISHDAGRQLIGDALELRHRLPRLFDLVLAGTVPAWRARQAAALTTRLTPAPTGDGDLGGQDAGLRPPAPHRAPGPPDHRGDGPALRPGPGGRRRTGRARRPPRHPGPRHRPGHHRGPHAAWTPSTRCTSTTPWPTSPPVCAGSATPTPSMSAGPRRSGSSPTRNGPSTSSTPASYRRPPVAGGWSCSCTWSPPT